MADFKRSLAVVIGINEYQDYPKLQTARYDAERLAEILVEDQKYDYVILVTDDTYKEYRQGQELPVKNKYQPTLDGLLNLLGKRLPAEINPTQEDRLVFYFAGHGIPDDSDEGPKGYLVPLDADSKKRRSLLPMKELYNSLAELKCRHFLIILDCCFAGRFSWSSTRKGRTFPKVIHKEHYDRFINSPAWQAITSASHDQVAFDILDNRGTVEGTNHSPFAEGLFKALRGEADVIPASKNGQPAGDGVITATELYLYLRDYVEIGSKERQTPGLWSLPKHERGEYIFLVPGAELKLKPAPPVNEKNNPYRGLESFDEEHSRFFFGMEELIQQLSERISAPKQPLTVVLGVSGSGKSSLVKAGLIPRLKNPSKSEVSQANPVNINPQWHILNPMRPGGSPFNALAKAVLALADVTGSNQSDTLNFLNVSTRLDKLTFLPEILKEKVNELDKKLAESSVENGEESSETLRLKKEVEKFISMAKGWHQGIQKAKQLLIVEHFEELYTFCRNPAEQQQLQQVVADCLNPLSLRLQSDPNQLIDIVRAWSHKHPGVRLLLTIDQFEELITLSQRKQKDRQNNQQQQWKKFWNWLTQKVQQKNKQEEWQQFLNLIEKTLSANLEQLRIIVTLRSDFEPRFLNSDALKSYWTKARFPVRAMRSDELRQAIERPAVETALYFEPPSLVDKLIDEVGQMPGALPLLSFTLSEFYIKLAQKWGIQETSDRALRLDADFDKEGGVAGSLTRRANEEYNNLPDDAHRDTLRRVMLRMVTFEGGELARRRVRLSELVYADAVENERVKLVLECFDRARLIVSGQETGEPYVEPAHDFLVRSWDKLQEWQQDEQEALPLQRRLTPAALEWKSKQEARFLWNADPYLDVLKQVLTSEKNNWFNQVEAEFVWKSVWRRRSNVQLRWVIAIGVIVILLGLTVLALWNRQLSDLRAQAAEARNRTSVKPIDALKKALEATGQPLSDRVFEVRSSLLNAVQTPKERNKLSMESSSVAISVDALKDGRIVSFDGRTISFWEKKDNQMNWKKQEDLPLPNGSIPSLAVCDDAIVYGTLSENKQNLNVFIQNLRNNISTQINIDNISNTIIDHANHPEVLAISSDCKTIAYNNRDKVRLYKLDQPRFLDKPIKRPEWINTIAISIAISPDGQYVVTAGSDNILRRWNLNGEPVGAPFQGNNDVVTSIAFSPDGKFIVGGSRDNSLRLWDICGNLIGEPLQGHDSWVRAVAFSPDGRSIISSSNDSTIRLWDVNTERITSLLPQENCGIRGGVGQQNKVAISKNGKDIITTDSDSINAIAITDDGETSVGGGEDGKIFLWYQKGNLIDSKKVSRNQGDKSKVTAIAITPDGKSVVSGTDKGTLQFWNIQDKQFVKVRDFNKYPVDCTNKQKNCQYIKAIALSHDGNFVASGSNDNIVRLWNKNGELVYEFGKRTKPEFRGHTKPIESIAFSHNGKLIASGSQDNTVKLWNTEIDQDKPKDLQGHIGWVSAIAFSPDDKFIATGSWDKTVRLWDRDGGNPMGSPFKGHTQWISSIRFSSNGKSIISGSAKDSVRRWQAGDPEDWRKEACSQLRDHPDFNKIRHLCDNISPSTPSQQTPTANSLAPSIVQPSAQNAPSPAPSSNNGQNNSRQAPSDRNQPSKLNTSVDTHINQGLTYHRQRNYQQAISSYSKAIALNPNSAIAYSYRAAAYIGQRDYHKAIADSSKAISLKPTYVNAYINRGIAYYRQGNYKEAIANYNKAIQLAPSNANAYNYRALAYTRLGNQQAAQADKRRAAALSRAAVLVN